jgi:hypothetical protein
MKKKAELYEMLTEREMEILLLIAKGYSSVSISYNSAFFFILFLIFTKTSGSNTDSPRYVFLTASARSI